jgi:Septum formation initiator
MARRKRKKNRTGLGIVALVVLLLCGIVSYNRVGLAKEKAEEERQIARLDTQIKKEEQRGKELKEQKDYMKTRKYIEEVAREKLGLVYPDEIIFEPKE